MRSSRGTLPSGSYLCVISLLALAGGLRADVVAPPTVQRFVVWKDANADGQFQTTDTNVTCITNMLQYLSAGTSYGYKQYDYSPGMDLSAWPNSSDGLLTGQVNATWLKPQANTLQFWMGWSQLDHNPANPTYATAAKGFNMGVIMNAEPPATWDNTLGMMVHHITAGIPGGNVQLSFAVKGTVPTPLAGESTDSATLAPRVVLSDDFTSDPTKYFTSYNTHELPRVPAPTTIDPYPTFVGQELVPNPVVPTGYQYAFTGNWHYNTDTTDGGVLGNLRPDPSDPGNFVIAITLDKLYDPILGRANDPNAINQIIFYSFPLAPGTYDPNDPASYNQAAYSEFILNTSQFQNGDTIFITGVPNDMANCCDIAPEPVTLALLAVGGLGLFARRAMRSRKSP